MLKKEFAITTKEKALALFKYTAEHSRITETIGKSSWKKGKLSRLIPFYISQTWESATTNADYLLSFKAKKSMWGEESSLLSLWAGTYNPYMPTDVSDNIYVESTKIEDISPEQAKIIDDLFNIVISKDKTFAQGALNEPTTHSSPNPML